MLKDETFWIESSQVSTRKGKWKVNISPGTKLCAIRLVFCHCVQNRLRIV